MLSANNRRNVFASNRCTTCGVELVSKGNGYYVCPNCNEIVQDDLSKMRQFLSEYPNSNARVIAAQFSMDPAYVQQFFDSGELSETAIKKAQRHCQRCRKAIPFGRYCEECTQKMANDLRNAFR